MNRITSRRVAIFVGVMTAIAILIYLPQQARKQRQAQENVQRQQAQENAEVAQAAAQKAAAEHAAYLSRYLNPGFARKPGLKNVAIAAASEDNIPSRSIADALADHLQNPNLVLFTSIFKPAFYTDGLFNSIYSGSSDSVDRLALTNTLDALVFAREQLQYSTNGAEVNNIITAHIRLDVAFMPLSLMRKEQSWTFTANGAGFSQMESRKNAEDRLFKQISSDTNMSLVSLSNENNQTYR